MTVVDPATDAPIEALRPYCPEPALRPLWRAGFRTVGDVARAGDLTVLRGLGPDRAQLVATAVDLWQRAGCPPAPDEPAKTARTVAAEREQARRVERQAVRFGLTRADVWSTTQVLERVRPGILHRSAVRRLPGFPPPLFTIAPSANFWRRTDVEAWMLTRPEPAKRDKADRDRAFRDRERARRARARQDRLATVGRPQRSEFRGVRWNAASGMWRAVVCLPADDDGPARELSGGLYHDEADAARAVDYYRWTVGFPPANFPADMEGTLAREGEWTCRRVRGVGEMILAVLDPVRPMTVDEVHEAVELAATTRGSVAAMLAGFARSGKVRRILPGKFCAPIPPETLLSPSSGLIMGV